MIALGSDHAGYKLKKVVLEFLEENGYEYRDLGTFDDCSSVDYPDFGQAVAEGVSKGEYDKGIIVCGSGIGISISANKVPGVRAALCTDCYMAKMSRQHNDANILALGERVVGTGLALEIVDTWLKTEFLGERHQRRVDMIANIEKKYK